MLYRAASTRSTGAGRKSVWTWLWAQNFLYPWDYLHQRLGFEPRPVKPSFWQFHCAIFVRFPQKMYLHLIQQCGKSSLPFQAFRQRAGHEMREFIFCVLDVVLWSVGVWVLSLCFWSAASVRYCHVAVSYIGNRWISNCRPANAAPWQIQIPGTKGLMAWITFSNTILLRQHEWGSWSLFVT